MEKEKEDFNFSFPSFVFGGVFAGVACIFAMISTLKSTSNYEPTIPLNGRTEVVMEYDSNQTGVVREYDLNQDGLADLVLPNGTVQLRNSDGNYTRLGDVRREAIREASARYELIQEKARNSVDNLDYKVTTGRYVLGSD